MGRQNDVGVFQLENGLWAFRYTFTTDGKRISKRGSKDEFGAPLRTKKDAIKARQAALALAQDGRKPKPVARRTVKEVYQEYCASGRKDRAYQTIRKQDSIWDNHLCAKFGKRFVDEISSAEVNDYSSRLPSPAFDCCRGAALALRRNQSCLRLFRSNTLCLSTSKSGLERWSGASRLPDEWRRGKVQGYNHWRLMQSTDTTSMRVPPNHAPRTSNSHS